MSAQEQEIKIADWERITDPEDLYSVTWRLSVPGGWIVRQESYPQNFENGVAVALCFVPDPNHDWKI